MARFTKVAASLLVIASMSPALADEGASGLYVPGNFGFGAGVTPGPGLYLSSGAGYYDGDIKVYIDAGKIVLDVVKRPFTTMYAALWVPETKILGGQLGLSLRSSYNYAWAHGVVTGLIAEDKTVAGWGLGDTIPRAQLGWTAGGWSNTLYVTGWLPTGRYQRGFEPNTGKNRYGLNLGWGVTYLDPEDAARVRFRDRRDLEHAQSRDQQQERRCLYLGMGGRQGWDQWPVDRSRRLCRTGDHGDAGACAQARPVLAPRVSASVPQIVYNYGAGRVPVGFNLHNYQEFGAVNRYEGNVRSFAASFKF